MKELSEGRVVHYVAYDNRHLLAIVIKLDREKEFEKPVRLDLAIFNGINRPRTGLNLSMQDMCADHEIGLWKFVFGMARLVANDDLLFQSQIPFNSDKVPGTWHWVEGEGGVISFKL